MDFRKEEKPEKKCPEPICFKKDPLARYRLYDNFSL